jgi:pimeloyl-ACP methyl ester carboxylesterase
LLHSAWGDAELSWSRVWDELSDSFTVVAPDMPGFGRSGPSAPISLSESVRLLRELPDHLKLDRVVVMGNSFGVALATEFALAYPDRVSRLVVVNGGYLPFLPSFIKKIIGIPVVENKFRAFMRSMIYSEKAFTNAFPNKHLLPPGFFECIRKHEEQHSRAVFNAFMLQARAQAAPKVPTTLLWGTGDKLLSPKQTERVQKWFADAPIVPLAGAGHLPQVEQPKEFVETVRKISK